MRTQKGARGRFARSIKEFVEGSRAPCSIYMGAIATWMRLLLGRGLRTTKSVGRRRATKISGWVCCRESKIRHVVSATPRGTSERCHGDFSWCHCEYHNITIASWYVRAVSYTSAWTNHLIFGILLIPGTGQMVCLVTQRGNISIA